MRRAIGLITACSFAIWLAAHASAGTTKYSYDSFGRLVTVTYADGATVNYQYDKAGNRTVVGKATGPNNLPVAVNDTTTTAYLTSKTFDPRTNDTDADGDPLSITAETDGAHGTVSHTATSVTYTPASGWSGSDSFTYIVSDGRGNDTGTVTITTANSPPVAVTDSISTSMNTAKTFDPRANDRDPNGATLTITAHGTAAHGTVSHTSTSVTYTPTTGYVGSDAFTYTISDGTATASATVNVTVASTNHNPTCSNWSIYLSGVPTTVATAGGTVAASAFIGHCTDADGDTLTLTSPAMPFSFSLTPGQSLSYPYSVSDGHGGTASATLNVSRP